MQVIRNLRSSMVLSVMVVFVIGGLFGGATAETEQYLIKGKIDFSDGLNGWWWDGKEGGKPSPGKLDADTFQSPPYSLYIEGGNTETYITKTIASVEPVKAYRLSVYIKTEEVGPENAVIVNLQQWTGSNALGWVYKKGEGGVHQIIKTGGTHDWKRFEVNLDVWEPDANSLTVYLRLEGGSKGKAWFDDIVLEELPQKEDKSELKNKENEPELKTFYHPLDEDPAVLEPDPKPALALRIDRDSHFFFTDEEINVDIEVSKDNISRKDADALSYTIKDYEGEVIRGGKFPIDKDFIRHEVKFRGRGYYEIEAVVKAGDEEVIRRWLSIGIITRPDEKFLAPHPEMPFGLWVGQDDLYPLLGVKWTRRDIGWEWWEGNWNNYRDNVEKSMQDLKQNNIEPIIYVVRAFPERVLRPGTSEVPKEEYWDELAEYVEEMVKIFGRYTNVWQVMNEPYRGMWKGTDEDYMRINRIVYQAVKKHYPDTMVIGASLNPMRSHLVAQSEDLLKLGLGSIIDGIDIHPYPEVLPEQADFVNIIEKYKALFRRYNSEKPLYTTEMGFLAGRDKEHEQAQCLVRSMFESMRLGIKAVIWHCGSWPQGPIWNERNIAIFRASREGGICSPRPAAVAYAVMARQLMGARYVRSIDYLGSSVKAYVFERNGEPIVVLWEYLKKEREVSIELGSKQVKVVNITGKEEEKILPDGILNIKVTQDPVYIHGGLAEHLLKEGTTLFQVNEEGYKVIPGRESIISVIVNNVFKKQIKGKLIFYPPLDWSINPEEIEVELEKGERKELERIKVSSPVNALPDIYPVYVSFMSGDNVLGKGVIKVIVEEPFKFKRLWSGFTQKGIPIVRGEIEVARELLPSELSVKIQEKEGKNIFSNKNIRLYREEETSIEIPVPAAEVSREYRFKINMSDKKGRTIEKERRFIFTPAIKADKVKIDGMLDEWQEVPFFPVSHTSSYPDNDPWRGETDLTAKVGFQWDENNLYVAVEVNDELHLQKHSGDDIWQQDSIQLGIAADIPERLIREPVYELHETNFYEYNIALTGEKKVEVYLYGTMDKGGNPIGRAEGKITAAVRRDDNKGLTVYEIRFPREAVSLKKLQEGDVLKVVVCINDDDGKGRRWIQWFDGMARYKDPELFGQVTLLSTEAYKY